MANNGTMEEDAYDPWRLPDLEKTIKEICTAVAKGAADAETSTKKLADVAKENGEFITEKIADRLFLLWELADPEFDADSGEEKRARLKEFVGQLGKADVIESSKWLASCELEFLEATGFISSAADLKKKEIRYYTKAVYLQQRYNLFRECTEGFARALAVLASLRNANLDLPRVEDNLRLVIGEFRLDPHRVLDVVIDCLPAKNFNGSFEILNLFDKEKATHLLGRKFSFFTNKGYTTPVRMYDLTVSLIEGDWIDFELLFVYLSPTREKFHEAAAQLTGKLRETVEKIEMPNLNKKRAKTEENEDVSTSARHPFRGFHPSKFEAIGMECLPRDNQVLKLAAAFLRKEEVTDKDMEWATLLWTRMTGPTDSGGRASHSRQNYAETFCSTFRNSIILLIERIVDPIYQKLFQETGGPGYGTDPLTGPATAPLIPSIFEDKWMVRVLNLLETIGYAASKSPSTLSKVCWVLAHEAKYYERFDYDSKWSFFGPPPKLKRPSIEQTLATCLLPALSFSPNCTQLSDDIYRVMTYLPYHIRFLVYSNYFKLSRQVELLDGAGVLAEHSAKQVVKRLVINEDRNRFLHTVLPLAGQIRKVGVHCPMHITGLIVSRAISDDNLQEALVLLMKQLLPLAFDTFGFWVIYHTVNTQSEKISQGDHVWWFKNVTKFLGRVCKEYPTKVPLPWILQSIIQELYGQDFGNLHVFDELLTQMTGFKACSLVGSGQLDALEGGLLLKSVVLLTPWHSDPRSYLPPGRALREALALPTSGLPGIESKLMESQERDQHNIAGHLLVLLLKAIEYIPIKMDSSMIKFVMEVTDRAMDTYTQYIDFLTHRTKREEYAKLLPPIRDVVNMAGCRPDWVFYAYRSLVTDIRTSEKTEEGEITAEVEESAGQGQNQGRHGAYTFQGLVQEVTEFEDMKEKGVWNCLTPEFFTLFWTLSLQDLKVPEEKYAATIGELQDKLSKLRRRDSEHMHRNDRSRFEREKSHVANLISDLTKERDEQRKRVEHVRNYVKGIKDTVLASIPARKQKDIPRALIQYCIFPRLKMGLEEGLFVWEFMCFVHQIGMVNFRTIILWDKVVKEVFPMMHTMTDREGAGFRSFMGNFLKATERWRGSKSLFDAEVGGKPGCAISFSANEETRLMDHASFQRLNYKWVNRLSRTLKDFLEPHLPPGQEPEDEHAAELNDLTGHRYVLRRSSLLLLNHIVKDFPMLKGLANHLRIAAQYVKENSQYDDLSKMAGRFVNDLDRELARPERWVELKVFGGLPQQKQEFLDRQRRPDKDDMQVDEPARPPEQSSAASPHVGQNRSPGTQRYLPPHAEESRDPDHSRTIYRPPRSESKPPHVTAPRERDRPVRVSRGSIEERLGNNDVHMRNGGGDGHHARDERPRRQIRDDRGDARHGRGGREEDRRRSNMGGRTGGYESDRRYGGGPQQRQTRRRVGN